MYRAIVFCPYFGKLPTNFNLWLNSCSFNKTFKFVVFTDDNFNYDVPKNVIIIHLSFQEFKSKIQKLFPFKISLDNPYKLCDYKPLYGYIFNEYIKAEQYWGYCDLDMIFGDLEKFLPRDSYDKISHLGHLCLYKNSDLIKNAFKLKGDSSLTYIEIISNPMHFGFDEIGEYCINNILKKNNLSIYNFEKYIADISCARSGMVLSLYDNDKFIPIFGKRLFSFENGKIYSHELLKNRQIEKKEYAYIHFQKRKMVNKIERNINCFVITPKGFIDNKKIDKLLIDSYQGKNIYWFFKRLEFKYKALRKRIERKKSIKKIENN